jgi:hypothetical protein
MWFTPILLATPEAEIRRISVQNQPRRIVCKTYFDPTQKMAGGVA